MCDSCGCLPTQYTHRAATLHGFSKRLVDKDVWPTAVIHSSEMEPSCTDLYLWISKGDIAHQLKVNFQRPLACCCWKENAGQAALLAVNVPCTLCEVLPFKVLILLLISTYKDLLLQPNQIRCWETSKLTFLPFVKSNLQTQEGLFRGELSTRSLPLDVQVSSLIGLKLKSNISV